MATMSIFVSHSHHDSSFCHDLVHALREAGADVWYDEHNLGSGQLMEVVQHELGRCPVFILILSPAAFTSKWVRRETGWAYELADREPSRIILPVAAQAIEHTAFSPREGWLFLNDFKRIEAPSYQPYPQDEAIRRTLHALALTPAGEPPVSVAPQPAESADDLIARGKALEAQKRFAEALPLFERATRLAPRSKDAWGLLGYVLNELHRYDEALAANDRALSLGLNEAWVWYNKGLALRNLQRSQEALAAFEHALSLDPTYKQAWNGKGYALRNLQRSEEAIAAYDHALALDPNDTAAWNGKDAALRNLQRYQEALAVLEHVLSLDPTSTYAWNGKGWALDALSRFEEALAAFDHALSLDPTYTNAWNGKGAALRKLQRYQEALAAFDRALSLDPTLKQV